MRHESLTTFMHQQQQQEEQQQEQDASAAARHISSICAYHISTWQNSESHASPPPTSTCGGITILEDLGSENGKRMGNSQFQSLILQNGDSPACGGGRGGDARESPFCQKETKCMVISPACCHNRAKILQVVIPPRVAGGRGARESPFCSFQSLNPPKS